MSRRATAFLVVALLAPACTSAASGERAARSVAPEIRAVRIEATPSPTARPRTVNDYGWRPFAAVGGITLTLPSNRVELVAFHEANHDGARQLEPMSEIRTSTLETRERGTGSRSAADIVVDPESELRAPVTGTVKRAGTYVLYCENSDDYVVIAPDARPGWEVKLLHIDGVAVRAGDRVTAGQTVLASRPTRLPFESQVDEVTVSPTWPHVHIEVVDPTIPDRPSPGSGC